MQWQVESPATMSPATVSLNMGVIYIGSAATGGFRGVATLTVVHQTDIGVSLSGYGGLSSLAVTVQLVSGAGPHATVYSATVSSSSNTPSSAAWRPAPMRWTSTTRPRRATRPRRVRRR
jgi:hypothetical protein